MANATQNFRLISLLKAGNSVKKEVVAKELGVNLVSVPVYIHELKRLYKADIESVYGGRKVVAYRLRNKDVVVPQFRRGHVTKYVKKTAPAVVSDGSVAVPDKDLDVTQVSDREFADIRSSLGVSSFGSGSRSSDY